MLLLLKISDIENIDGFLYVSLALILYALLLFLLRKIGVWRKITSDNCSNACPGCKSPLERIRRKKIDYFINYLTFQIFDFKRYKCLNCFWEGRRWEKAFSGRF